MRSHWLREDGLQAAEILLVLQQSMLFDHPTIKEPKFVPSPFEKDSTNLITTFDIDTFFHHGDNSLKLIDTSLRDKRRLLRKIPSQIAFFERLKWNSNNPHAHTHTHTHTHTPKFTFDLWSYKHLQHSNLSTIAAWKVDSAW
jgi:hypothetical protein